MNLAKNCKNTANPIDLVEGLFDRKSFELERRSANEIAIEIKGKWNSMLLFFTFEESMKVLHMSCLMDIETTTEDSASIFELLAMTNETLWMGHFSYWNEQKVPVFKHSVIADENDEGFAGKLSQMIDIAIKECERMYPVFNVVLNKGMDPKRAMYPMLMETKGSA